MSLSIATVSLLVTDYDDAITFYCDTVGFDLVADTDLGGGKRWVVVAPPGRSGAQLLLAKAGNESQRAAVGNQGGGRVMFFLSSTSFARDHAAMVERGVKFIETPRHEPFGTVAVFEDLYGNKWDLIEPKGLMLALVLLAAPAAAQEAGWHYSPLPGEGDRATLGCALNSTPDVFACIAVRCEDDFSTGIHIHTSRPKDDEGIWAITIDKETRSFTAEASEPYGARLTGNVSWVLHNLANGAVAYLEPGDGSPMPANHIALDGSLYAINRALALCAPRTPNEPNAVTGVE